MKSIKIKGSTVSITDRGSVEIKYYQGGGASRMVYITQEEFEAIMQGIVEAHFLPNVKGVRVVQDLIK